MKRFVVLGMVLAMVTAFNSGCDKKKAEVKDSKTVTTPDGSTTVTDTQKVETTGDNPPPAK